MTREEINALKLPGAIVNRKHVWSLIDALIIVLDECAKDCAHDGTAFVLGNQTAKRVIAAAIAESPLDYCAIRNDS